MKQPDETRLTDLFERFSPTPSEAFYHRSFPWKGSASMKKRPLYAAAAAIVLLALAVLTISPLRTFAQDSFRDLFVNSDSDTLDLGPSQPFVNTSQQMEAIADAEATVGYDIIEPTTLPDFLTFGRVIVFPDNSVALLYQDVNGNSVLTINQTPAAQPNTQGVGASAAIESLEIGSIRAEYVRGVWMGAEGSDEAVWMPEVNVQNLTWWANSVQFTISADGEVVNLVREITKEELIEVARTMIEQ
jgi:hypothetical protein